MMYALIVAGGSGTRMGSQIPKQFLRLGDAPIIVNTLRKMKKADGICVAVPRDYLENAVEILEMFQCEAVVCAGGKDRMESIEYGFSAICNKWSVRPDDVVLTHDGVRPFLTEKMIQDTAAQAKEHGAAGTFLGAVDTIAVSKDGGWLSDVPDRSQMYQVQTPQTFRVDVLKKMLECGRELKQDCTDLCGLAQKLGIPVKMCQGDPKNIKITSPFDLAVGQVVFNQQKEETV